MADDRGGQGSHPRPSAGDQARRSVPTSMLKATRARELSEEQLRAAVAGSRDGVWDWNLETNEAFYSERFATMLGYEAGELPFTSAAWSDLLHPEDRDAALRTVEQYLQRGGGEAYESTFRMRAKDGSYRWIIGRGMAVLDEAGKPVRLVGFNTDITRLKETEEALRQSDEQNRSIIAALPDLVFELDRNATYLHAHSPDGTGFAVPPKDFLGRRVHDVLDAEISKLTEEMIHKTLTSGEMQVYTYALPLEGGERFFEARMVPKGTSNVLTIVRDVTSQRRAEEAITSSEAKFRLVFEQSKDAICILQDDRFRLVNPQFSELTGYPVADILKFVRPYVEFIAPEDRASLLERRAKRLRGEPLPDIFEFSLLHRDGAMRRVEASVTAVEYEDRPALLVVLRDVSQQRALEEQLRQSQKMETVGRLAGGVAHDFNNMLGIILGNLDLAKMELDDASPIHDEINEIEAAAIRAAELTSQLLGFARKQTVSPKVLDFNQAIEGMLRMLQRLIGENIELRWSPEPTLCPVEIDPNQVDQILTNLVVNARDAIAGCGTLTIQTQDVHLDTAFCSAHPEATPGRHAVLQVSDTGVGMDAAVQKNIFEPFFTTKPQGMGTGLGLATVYGIVRQNNGVVTVASEPGKGSTFSIYLPSAGDVSAVPEKRLGQTRPVGGSETILIVEDEQEILDIAVRMMKSLGYKVLSAGRPHEAIGLAQQHLGAIDLLITDVMMPQMNGKELAQEIGRTNPGVRILFMSGFTATIITDDGVVDEGTHFLQKPFTREVLARHVRRALEEPRRE